MLALNRFNLVKDISSAAAKAIEILSQDEFNLIPVPNIVEYPKAQPPKYFGGYLTLKKDDQTFYHQIIGSIPERFDETLSLRSFDAVHRTHYVSETYENVGTTDQDGDKFSILLCYGQYKLALSGFPFPIAELILAYIASTCGLVAKENVLRFDRDREQKNIHLDAFKKYL